MRNIKYILVNESYSETAVRAIRNSHVSEFRHSHIISAAGLSRPELISVLLLARKQWPEAPILGVSEIDPSASHAPVRVNPEMNALRREMSDLP